MGKILKFSEITDSFIDAKNAGKKVVLIGGCFDILHYGHVRFLQQSKNLGDILAVALESDENVKRIKGKNRPFQSQEERAEILAEMNSVDFIILLPPISKSEEYENLVKKISPSYVALTQGDKVINEKTKFALKYGGVIKVIPKLPSHSSSTLAKLLGLD